MLLSDWVKQREHPAGDFQQVKSLYGGENAADGSLGSLSKSHWWIFGDFFGEKKKNT